MNKIALGAKLTTAFKTVAGKARESGQKAVMGGGKKSLTSVPYMFKGAMGMPMSYGAAGMRGSKMRGLGLAAPAMRPGAMAAGRGMSGTYMNPGTGMSKVATIAEYARARIREARKG